MAARRTGPTRTSRGTGASAPPKATASGTKRRTGGMTVQEAGRKGGLIGGRKGGETVKAERGVAFYQEIGRKGGQRVRALIEAGKAAMEGARRRGR